MGGAWLFAIAAGVALPLEASADLSMFPRLLDRGQPRLAAGNLRLVTLPFQLRQGHALSLPRDNASYMRITSSSHGMYTTSASVLSMAAAEIRSQRESCACLTAETQRKAKGNSAYSASLRCQQSSSSAL